MNDFATRTPKENDAGQSLSTAFPEKDAQTSTNTCASTQYGAVSDEEIVSEESAAPAPQASSSEQNTPDTSTKLASRSSRESSDTNDDCEKNSAQDSREQEESVPEKNQPDGLTKCRMVFDAADKTRMELAIRVIPEEFRNEVRRTSHLTADALRKEGTPAALRVLAKDISIRRASIAQADAMVAAFRNKALADPNFDLKRLEAAERAASAEHKRLMDSISVFERLSRPSLPTMTLKGGPNYVAIGKAE